MASMFLSFLREHGLVFLEDGDFPCTGVAKKRIVFLKYFSSKDFCIDDAGMWVNLMLLFEVMALLVVLVNLALWGNIWFHRMSRIYIARKAGDTLSEIVAGLRGWEVLTVSAERYITELELTWAHELLHKVLADEYPCILSTAETGNIFTRYRHAAGFWVSPTIYGRLQQIDFLEKLQIRNHSYSLDPQIYIAA